MCFIQAQAPVTADPLAVALRTFGPDALILPKSPAFSSTSIAMSVSGPPSLRCQGSQPTSITGICSAVTEWPVSDTTQSLWPNLARWYMS